MKEITICHDVEPEECLYIIENLLSELGIKYQIEDGNGYIKIKYNKS